MFCDWRASPKICIQRLLVLSGDFRDFLSELELLKDRRAPFVAPIPLSRPPASMSIAVSSDLYLNGSYAVFHLG